MRTVKSYCCVIAMICISCPAMGNTFDNIVQGEILHLNNDTTVLPTAWIKSDVVNIDDSVYLYNQGRISNDVFICDACNVYIQNSGKIYGAVHVPMTANLTQVIKSADDATHLNIDGEYEILIYNAKQLDWNIVRKYSDDVTGITFVNSEIVLPPDVAELSLTAPASIELIGENNFWITQNYVSSDVPVLLNVTGDGAVNFHIENMNPLYAAVSYVYDGNLYAKVVRETDYFKIFGNDTGNFLNSLREINANDKLLSKLDAAPDMAALHHILNKSMRMNPGRLVIPLQTLNRHIDGVAIMSNESEFAHFMPLDIIGNNIMAYGLRGMINLTLTDTLGVSLSAYAANMDFSDGIDDYSANLIGGDVVAQYNDSDIFAYSRISVMGAKFATPAVLDDGNVTYNPTALIANANINAGPRFAVGDALTIVPILGLGVEYNSVLNNVDMHGTINTGFITQYSYQTGDILYKYSVHIGTDSNGDYNGRLHIGITSPDDDTTVCVGLGFVNDEMGMSYNATASLIFNF